LSLPIDLEADMPELWLTYGERDVVLDIKVENLNEFRNSKFNNIQDQDLAQQIEITSLDNLRIFAAEGICCTNNFNHLEFRKEKLNFVAANRVLS
jgi:hypothetical protein